MTGLIASLEREGPSPYRCTRTEDVGLQHLVFFRHRSGATVLVFGSLAVWQGIGVFRYEAFGNPKGKSSFQLLSVPESPLLYYMHF